MPSTTATVSPVPGRFLDLRAAVISGIIGSLVFQVLEIILIPLAGGGEPWGPARMIAAMVLGPRVLPPPATFDAPIVLVALIVDIVLAIIYAAIIGTLVHRWPRSTAIIVGAVFGALLYGVNFYIFTAIFPWFVMGRNFVTLFTHIVFSVTVVFLYLRLSRRPAA